MSDVADCCPKKTFVSITYNDSKIRSFDFLFSSLYTMHLIIVHYIETLLYLPLKTNSNALLKSLIESA